MTENIEKIVESLLLSSSRPLTEAEILKAFNDSDDVNSADIKEALNFANQVAAISTTKQGAAASMPSLEDIKSY